QPQLHQGKERVAPGQQLGVVTVLAQEGDGLLGRARPGVVELGRDHLLPPWIAAHTRLGDAGMSMSVTPKGCRASTMALITAGVEAIVPASPMPFTPIGLVGLGVTVWSRVSWGNSAALGTR